MLQTLIIKQKLWRLYKIKVLYNQMQSKCFDLKVSVTIDFTRNFYLKCQKIGGREVAGSNPVAPILKSF